MKSIKKLLVFGLISILLFGMAACNKGGKKADVATPTSGNTPVETPVSTPVPTPVPTPVHTHEFGGWEPEPGKEATLTKAGSEINKCTTCDYTETRPSPKLIYQRVDQNGTPDKNGEYILFGFYPQTVVSDTVLIATLSTLKENTITGYINYEGEEYAKIEKAAPYNKITFSDGKTSVEKDKEYYFKVEPIKWRILNSTNTKTAFLFSVDILDIGQYATSEIGSNYQKSIIQNWLNDAFYSKAFPNDELKLSIDTTTVDNSAGSTWFNESNFCSCPTTYDKVFLLSYKEASAVSDANRKKIGTDYAKAKGLYCETNGYWWLRSPSYYDKPAALYSKAQYINYYGAFADTIVERANLGVVPAINLSLG